MGRHLHLDPVGGIAGDMFVAALLHLAPELHERCLRIAHALLPGEAEVTVEEGSSCGIVGRRLKVTCVEGDNAHHHRHLSDIDAILRGCAELPAGAKLVAIDIFTRLAKAEATVHGTSMHEVHFHEVGAVDSIIDIALSGFLIEALQPTSISLSPLPRGGGMVETLHGAMPVPAPATAILLEGFDLIDDGLPGERVTPTGAAILAHLKPLLVQRVPAGRMGRTGMGMGTRILPGKPNMLRVIEVEPSPPGKAWLDRDMLASLSFEIDDQTGEDLAYALDVIREVDGVRDALQYPVFGKKGRMGISVRILCDSDAIADVATAVFDQTSTLGIREELVSRHILVRKEEERDGIGVKLALRPGGTSCKAELNDLVLKTETRIEREALRRRVETEND